MNFGKGGQVTVFIIVGIVILIVTGIFFWVKNYVIEDELSLETGLRIAEVPVEFTPVSNFVKTCITDTLEKGLRIIGEKGGFIDLVGHGIITKNDVTESDAVRMSPGSDYSVPYWYYMKSPNKCFGQCDYMVIPENALYLRKSDGSPSIEGQLETYVNDNLDTCLGNFEVLENEGFDIDRLGEVDAQVSVRDNSVLALVTYPLEVSKVGVKDVSEFFVTLPVSIEDIYELSNEIVQLQGRYRYLEKHLLNLIVGFSAVKSDRLPPMHDTVIQLGGTTSWSPEKVKRDLGDILTNYVQLLQVSNTRNYEIRQRGNKMSNSLYNSGMLVPVDGDYSGLEVSFLYHPEWWPMYFDINCDGTCGPESAGSNLMALIGIQRYSFSYDVSYPVLVEIKDPRALNNRGYSFYFLMESNLRNNDVMEPDYLPPPVIDSSASMLCDKDKRNSGDITIEVKDADGYKVDNANVVYTCFDESCLIGETSQGSLTANFPSCLGGIVSVVKDGYLGKSKAFNIDAGKEDSLDFVLNPIMLKNFVVRKKLIEKQNGHWIPTMRIVDLKENEDAIVLIEKVGSAEEENLQSGGTFEGNQTEDSEIRIGAGEFKVTIYLTLDEKMVIPEGEIGGEEIPRQELPEPYQSGGLIANYTFDYAELRDSGNIVFYALSPNLYDVPLEDRTIEDLPVVVDIHKLSSLYWYGAWPTYE